MSAQHTPGDWFTMRTGFSTIYVESRIGGGLIQEVAACGPTNEGPDQQEANARLISAAPELLEAVKLLMGPLESMVDNMNAAHKARAAINKATGATP